VKLQSGAINNGQYAFFTSEHCENREDLVNLIQLRLWVKIECLSRQRLFFADKIASFDCKPLLKPTVKTPVYG
jgi:hypothetical protein